MIPNTDGVGKNWPYQFIERLGPEYSQVKQKPMDPKRLIAEDLGVIETWFDRLKIQIDLHQIHSTR